MAEKRMFSLKVIDTDAFLDMPLSTQALYFHLSMRADDDGFVANPNKIMRMTNSSKNDFDLLIVKRYLIPFESGICVIKHWRMNNYLRSDRYTETTYLEEKRTLEVKENGIYTEKNGVGIPQGIPYVAIDKSSIEKNREDKNSKKASKPQAVTFDIIISEFTQNEELHKTIIEFIKMRKLNKSTMTDKALKLLLGKLEKYNDSERISMLNEFIEKCWKTVYEKTDKHYGKEFKSQYTKEKLESVLGDFETWEL